MPQEIKTINVGGVNCFLIKTDIGFVLIMNMIKPDIHFLIDDLSAASASIEKLKSLNIKTVYPGHGKPFPWEQFPKDNKRRL